MAVVMYMEWDGVKPEQYDETRERVDWEGDVPDGAVLHVPCFTEKGARIVDVWDSAEQFQAFVEQRLMPAVQEIGIEGEPRVDIRPLHGHVFAPRVETVTA